MRTDAARNRTRILSSARLLVGEHGPQVSMDAIAVDAGVAVGTLYRHFPTKADLVAAVIEESIGRFAEQAEAALGAVAGAAAPGDQLASLVRAFATTQSQDRALKAAAAMLGSPVPDDVADLPAASQAHRAVVAVEALLEAARVAGQVRADLTLDDVTMLLAGVPEDAGRRARYVDIVLAGLLPAAPRR